MQAKFTQGSILSHIITMTLSSGAGLASLFLVDLIDMYWLSLLGEVELAAAVGYAGSILFFTLSLSIGLSIGCGALVSHAIGAGDRDKARQLVANLLVIIVGIAIPVATLFSTCQGYFLNWLGATGRAHELAYAYMAIVLPSMPLLAVAMACSGVLRAMGMAKDAMWLTLLGGFVNAVLDPVFIFGFAMNIEGAAVATVLSRVAMIVFGLWLVAKKADLLGTPCRHMLKPDFFEYSKTAGPAVLTNLSSPIGILYITSLMATFGDGAVAGNAVVSRLQPLAFAGLFALSGAIGPIAGQNLGAGLPLRIMATLRNSMYFIGVYCVLACGILFLTTDWIIHAFNAEGDAADIIRWFCYGLSSMFLFNGITFSTNALFNNLKAAHIATQFNFARATIGTMPFAYVGAEIAGPFGLLFGVYIGNALVALGGWYVAYQKIHRLCIKKAA